MNFDEVLKDLGLKSDKPDDTHPNTGWVCVTEYRRPDAQKFRHWLPMGERLAVRALGTYLSMEFLPGGPIAVYGRLATEAEDSELELASPNSFVVTVTKVIQNLWKRRYPEEVAVPGKSPRTTVCTQLECQFQTTEDFIGDKRIPLDRVPPRGFEFVGLCPRCGHEMVAQADHLNRAKKGG